VTEPNQPGSQLRDVNVLTSGIDAADCGQWACVFRHQGDAHGNSPSSGQWSLRRYPALL
jgi:hypothetical protein